MNLGMLVVLLAAAAVTPGQTTTQSTPRPVLMAPGPGGMGYYLMSGTRIVSQSFSNVSDCYKVLAKIKATMQPGTSNVVCAYRRP
jgi:hypothetical protein